MQHSEPVGKKHARDTLLMPVTSLGLQHVGGKRSFSCLGATASLGRQAEPFALPSRKGKSLSSPGEHRDVPLGIPR